jgi:2'-5' RNA ligase
VATQRLFVAVTPSPAAIADLGAVVDGLHVSRANQPGHSTRLAARDRWHITVVFLGDVPSVRVAAAADAVRAATTNLGPFELCLAGGGTFGRGSRAILWSGLGGEVDQLRQLSLAVRRELRRARLPFDRKPLRAHLTLSRPGDRVAREQVKADVATLAGHSGPMWSVVDVQLMVSEMEQTATGPAPRYTPVATIALATPLSQ